MNKYLIVVIALTILVSACAPQAPAEPTSVIVEQPGGAGSSERLTSVEKTVVQQLAGNLGLDAADISVVDDRGVEFNDACLGVAMQDVTCAQVSTPGYVILLEADGIQYAYHTSEDGARIQPATVALTWSRDGGIAGFCDRLTVFLSGEVYGNQCSPQGSRMSTFASLLSQQEQRQFFAWMEKYRALTLDASDPKGVADGISLVLVFNGMGKSKPGKPVEQEIFTWARELFQKLYQ